MAADGRKIDQDCHAAASALVSSSCLLLPLPVFLDKNRMRFSSHWLGKDCWWIETVLELCWAERGICSGSAWVCRQGACDGGAAAPLEPPTAGLRSSGNLRYSPPPHLLGRGQHPNIPWPVALGFKSKGFQKRDLVAHLGSIFPPAWWVVSFSWSGWTAWEKCSNNENESNLTVQD